MEDINATKFDATQIRIPESFKSFSYNNVDDFKTVIDVLFEPIKRDQGIMGSDKVILHYQTFYVEYVDYVLEQLGDNLKPGGPDNNRIGALKEGFDHVFGWFSKGDYPKKLTKIIEKYTFMKTLKNGQEQLSTFLKNTGDYKKVENENDLVVGKEYFTYATYANSPPKFVSIGTYNKTGTREISERGDVFSIPIYMFELNGETNERTRLDDLYYKTQSGGRRIKQTKKSRKKSKKNKRRPRKSRK